MSDGTRHYNRSSVCDYHSWLVSYERSFLMSNSYKNNISGNGLLRETILFGNINSNRFLIIQYA